jgi:hypothetical protein
MPTIETRHIMKIHILSFNVRIKHGSRIVKVRALPKRYPSSVRLISLHPRAQAKRR